MKLKFQPGRNLYDYFRTLLIVVLLFLVTFPLTPTQASEFGEAARIESQRLFDSSLGLLKRWLFPSVMPVFFQQQGNEDPMQRIASVASLSTCPQRVILYKTESTNLSVLPLDTKGKVVHGVPVKWESLHPAIVAAASDGTVSWLDAGTAQVRATVGSYSTTITIESQSVYRPTLTNAQWDALHAADCGGAVGPMQVPDPEEILNTPEAAATFNATGHPRFTPAYSSPVRAMAGDEQLGSSNFNWSAPIFNAAGRGVGVGLSLVYNSRMWTKDGSGMVFDYDQGWPAAGFRLNYGRMIRNYDNAGNPLLIQADGTRISFSLVSSGQYRSTDGQNIDFNSNNTILLYPNGTRISYEDINNKVLPTKVEDIHGNSFTIRYVQNCATTRRVSTPPCTCGSGSCFRPPRQAIDYIVDTLGRIYLFYYYDDGNLAQITAPAYESNERERILAKFYYTTVNLSYDFGSLMVENPPPNNQLSVLSRVYFPETGRGYIFEEYSGYGMCGKISMCMGMTETANGATTAYTRYLHNTMGTLDDAPTFTERQEWWLNKTDANGNADNSPSIFTYARTNDVSTTTNSVTAQSNNVRTEMIAISGGSNNGLLSSMKVINGNNQTLYQEDYAYTTASNSGVQRSRVESVPDGIEAQRTRTENIYGNYGRLEETVEYGFKDTATNSYIKKRRIEYSYITDTGYINMGLPRLATEIKVYDAKGTNGNGDDGDPIDRTKLTYDRLGEAPDPNWEIEKYGFTNNCQIPACTPPPGYNTARVNRGTRGLVTRVEQWSSDTTSTTPQINFRHRYDIFGNEIKAEAGCCKLKNLYFTSSMYWSTPINVSDGDSGGAILTSSYLYDFNTGFVKQITDPNLLQTAYLPDYAMRVGKVTAPSGATVETFYSDPTAPNVDALTYRTKLTYLHDTTTKTETSRQWLDGAGRTLRSGSAAGDAPSSYDAVKMVYDALGRVTKSSNPYPSNNSGEPTGTTYWKIYTYDTSSRVTQVTMPDNTNIIQTAYSGAVTTVTDQVGRKRVSEIDGLGRVIKVTEMDDSKLLNWHTNYSYDMNDNLTLVDQGGQQRAYKYDALSRLTHERTPEQAASIVDNGNWSAKYTYTNFNAIASRLDARGVLTNYTYDTLNRLTNVNYMLPNPNPDNVQTTAPVTIQYGNSAAQHNNGQVTRIDDAAGYETYAYDALARLQSKTRRIDTRDYVTSYSYNQAGQLKLLTYPSNRQIISDYDTRGRLNSIPGYLNSVAYNPAQQVTAMTLANGVTESYGYSADRQQLTSQTAVKNSQTLMSLTYGYNATAADGGGTIAGNSGQLMSITGTVNGQNRNQSFKYDQVGRLAYSSNIDGAGVTKQLRYTYDRWNNRKKVEQWGCDSIFQPNWYQIQGTVINTTNGVPTTNRIEEVDTGCTDITWSNLLYDRNGNVKNDNPQGLEGDGYLYDGENRLVSMTRSGVQQGSYVYDAANRRVKKTVNGVTTHYVYEGSQVIGEYNGATGTMLVEFIYAGERMLAREQGSVRRYYHQDRLSVRLMSDNAGAVAGTQDHLPFGEPITQTGEVDKRRFTSYERDAESGTDYAINRQYSNTTGRFMQADPIQGSTGNPQSFNRYAYVQNDPINFVDPLGLLCYGYNVSFLVFDGNGNVVRELNFGFIPTYCDGGSGGAGGAISPDGSRILKNRSPARQMRIIW